MKEFLLIGDWGQEIGNVDPFFRPEWIERLKVLSYDELFLLGDNFYPSGVDSIDDPQWSTKLKRYFPITKKKKVILGNHDYCKDAASQIAFSFSSKPFQWDFPYFFHETFYPSISCHVFFLDTQILTPQYTTNLLVACHCTAPILQTFYRISDKLEAVQLRWLEMQLRYSKAKWKIVLGHYPVVSNGLHEPSLELERKLKPLLQKYRVDLYASGHDHNIQVLQEGHTHFLVSGALSYFNVPPVNHAGTKFIGSEKAILKLSVDKSGIYISSVTVQDEKTVYCLTKN